MHIKLTLSFLFLFVLSGFGQKNDKMDFKAKFWIAYLANDTMYDLLKYNVAQDSIIITRKTDPGFSGKYNIVFRQKLDNTQKASLSKISLLISNSKFNSYYYNPCIIHGSTIEFCFMWPDQTKRITVANYYSYKLGQVVDFVNNNVPDKYRILYNKIKLQADFKNCLSK
ncbi:hypothetical protein A4H97_29950 [Niastella yeongjuensis]|uniref:Uncharacterized protein n=1 Tax=Niastella yeongjuensis TaxID=354355 RepID=A0A1V9EPH6_9BACT|nr:hypothetical protein A4H97_29950 [Niastella yeongjuensis]SEO25148.1 hypothetical protein SAMN05660816_02390 [Niastella yeongjuensis]